MEWKHGTGRRLQALAIGIFALAFAGALYAGHHGAGQHRGPDPARMLAHMTAELGLDAGQQEAISGVLEGRRDDLRRTHEEMRATHRELRGLDPSDPNYATLSSTLARRQGELTTRMTVLRSEMHAEIMAVLNPEQQERFTEMRNRRGERMRGSHRRGLDSYDDSLDDSHGGPKRSGGRGPLDSDGRPDDSGVDGTGVPESGMP